MSLGYWVAAPDISKTLNSFYRNRILIKCVPGHKAAVLMQSCECTEMVCIMLWLRLYWLALSRQDSEQMKAAQCKPRSV